MRTTYPLGRVAGIAIGLHWSVLGLLALLMWTLATSVFPDTNPGLSDNAYFAMAVVASTGFFASILLHELGHAFQARRDGMRIDGITLWLFGGVARFSGMFPSAGAEFRIAIAGPLVSLALGVGFVGAALVPGIPESVDGACSWLGFINLALLVFNLLPALPLDGGRILRSALWAWKGDLRTATRLAAGGGRILAIAMIGIGLAGTAFLGLVSGIWLAVIGWFLLQAAGAEARYVESPVSTLRVGDMMEADPVVTRPDMTLDDVADASPWGAHDMAYPVVDDGRAVGLLPAGALTRTPRADWERLLVRDRMVGRETVPTLAVDDDLPAAVAALQRTDVESALVLDGERLVGLLTLADVARALGVGDDGRPPVSARR